MTWFEGMDARKEGEPKQYPWGKQYPYYHSERMNWAKAFVTEGDVDIIFLSGQTGRDPLTDRPARDALDERGDGGTVVGPGIKEQTIQALKVIKQSLEDVGASLENIVFFRYYLVNREDIFDFRQTFHDFMAKHCPDIIENPRCGTMLRGIGLDLPTKMVVEVEALAVKPRKKS